MSDHDSANATVFSPRVGIVSPCRNRLNKTRRFYEHVLAQSFGDFRIYLCDSASTDGTAEYFLDAQASEPRLRVIHALDSEYWTGATNRGVRAALADGCEYVMTINDDSVPPPDFLRRMIEAAVVTGHRILVPRIEFLDEPGRIWALGSYNDWARGEICHPAYCGAQFKSLPTDLQSATLLPVEFACGNGVLLSRDVFAKVGLYDEIWMPHYHADSDLLLRARSAGFHAYCMVGVTLFNDVHNDAGRSDHDSKAGRRLTTLLLSKRSDCYVPAMAQFILRHGSLASFPALIRAGVSKLAKRYRSVA